MCEESDASRARVTEAAADVRLMTDGERLTVAMSDEQAVRRAIQAISQSDPLVTLLKEVKLGRMKPDDPGLRAVTESWIGTYQQVIETSALDRSMLVRLDPSPRLNELIEAGILPADHAGAAALRAAFEKALSRPVPS